MKREGKQITLLPKTTTPSYTVSRLNRSNPLETRGGTRYYPDYPITTKRRNFPDYPMTKEPYYKNERLPRLPEGPAYPLPKGGKKKGEPLTADTTFKREKDTIYQSTPLTRLPATIGQEDPRTKTR